MSNKIKGDRVGIMIDEYTLELERLYAEQCEKTGEAKPSRSAIVRTIYREYLQKRIIIK